MLDIGGAEALIFFTFIYGAFAFALYWIIRLAVRHGIRDSQRAREQTQAVAAPTREGAA